MMRALPNASCRVSSPLMDRPGNGDLSPTEKSPPTLSPKEDDCDGWGEAEVPERTAVEKERELMRVRSEVQNKGGRMSTKRSSGNDKAEERDLFIPIFALVSLAGLFGSYGYEMLRLYSRGELYLPWDNK